MSFRAASSVARKRSSPVSRKARAAPPFRSAAATRSRAAIRFCSLTRITRSLLAATLRSARMPVAPIAAASTTIAPKETPTFLPKVHDALIASLLVPPRGVQPSRDRRDQRADVDDARAFGRAPDERAHVLAARGVVGRRDVGGGNPPVAFQVDDAEGDPPLVSVAEEEPRGRVTLAGVAEESGQVVRRHERSPDRGEPEQLRRRPGHGGDPAGGREARQLAQPDRVRVAADPDEEEVLDGCAGLGRRPGERLVEASAQRGEPLVGDRRRAHAACPQAASSARQSATRVSRVKPPPNRRMRAGSSYRSSVDACSSSRLAVTRSPARRAINPRCTWGMAKPGSRYAAVWSWSTAARESPACCRQSART